MESASNTNQKNLTDEKGQPGLPSPALAFSSLVAALGGLLFGFDTAVIAGTTDALSREFALSPFWLGFTVASALIGTIAGAFFVGRPADAWGRRTCLVLVAVLYLVSALGSALAWNWTTLIAFRFIGGLGVGGASVISPMYIAEISPPHFRGRLVATTQFNIVLGILVAFFSNYLVASFDLGHHTWRWMFGAEALPATLFLALVFFIPRSPRWLLAQGRTVDATNVLVKLGAILEEAKAGVAEIQRSLVAEKSTELEPLLQRKYAKVVGLAVAIAMFNQLSGINALMYYAPHIFEMAGAGESSALLQTIAVGGTNLVFTLAAMAIIDRVGRKRLMLIGSVGYILSLGGAAFAFYRWGTDFTSIGSTVVLLSLLVFIASHAFGQGAVIWVFLAEIFPNRIRARGQSLGSFTHWIMAAVISWTFPVIARVSGGHAFAFYALCAVAQLIWVIKVMPETRGVPLEQMKKHLNIETSARGGDPA